MEPNVIYLSRINPGDLYWVCFYLVATFLVWRRRTSQSPILQLAFYGYAVLLIGSALRMYVTTAVIARMDQTAPIRPSEVATDGFSALTYMSLFMGVLLVVGNILLLRAVLRSGTSASVA